MAKIESKTGQLVELLLHEIASGRYPSNSCFPSERELVGQYRVSRITVRRGLDALEKCGVLIRRQGKGTFVRDAGQKPNTSPAVRAIKRVGFLFGVARWENDFFKGIFHGFREFAGQTISTCVYFQDYLTPDVYRRDGLDVLIVDGDYDDTLLADLHRSGFKTITMNRVTPSGNYVCTNNEMGGYQMIAHLASKGHRTVAVFPASFAGPLPGDEMTQRIKGISRAARKFGIELVFLRPPVVNVMAMHEAIRDALRRGRTFTAVVTLVDSFAQFVYNEMLHAGVAVPDDVSIVGYDDNSFDPFLPVPLTSIRQPLTDMARALVRVVNDYVNGKPLRIRRQFAPALIERSSVCDLSTVSAGGGK